MVAKAARVRLYVDAPLGEGQSVSLGREQAHYLGTVLRLGEGAEILLFNGRDGEFRARLSEIGKRGAVALCDAQTAPLRMPPDLWLLFAPVKKARTDFIVEKAVEMGARRIQPVMTEFTNSERVRADRLRAHAVEAAEQCGATFVPELCEAVRLEALLEGWDAERRLMFCDEAAAGAPASVPEEPGPWAILVGPEGGFSERERARLRGLPFTRPVSLGPRILRAETAAVAAMALWQATLGDWR